MKIRVGIMSKLYFDIRWWLEISEFEISRVGCTHGASKLNTDWEFARKAAQVRTKVSQTHQNL